MNVWENITNYILEVFDERQTKATCLQMNAESIKEFKKYTKEHFVFNNAEEGEFCGVPIMCNNTIDDETVEVFF